MSQLIAASEDGARLNDEELRATAGLVLAAGFETTVNCSARHPDPARAFRPARMLLDDPDLWPARRGDPSARIAGSAERQGRPRGHRVAGPDRRNAASSSSSTSQGQPRSKVFADPHRFDITRENAGKHLSFSGAALLPRRRAGPRRRRGRLRTFFERYPDAAWQVGEPSRHQGLRRLVVPADRTWQGAQRGTFVGGFQVSPDRGDQGVRRPGFVQ